MHQSKFLLHLNVATAAMRARCTDYITNVLPPSNRYYVILNGSFDENPLHAAEKIFEDHDKPQTDQKEPRTEAEVSAMLWRDGFVPVWIDITPYEVNDRHTYFELLCAGRFTQDDGILYHQKEGYPPFHSFGPIVPPRWNSGDAKFDLHHHRDRKQRRGIQPEGG